MNVGKPRTTLILAHAATLLVLSGCSSSSDDPADTGISIGGNTNSAPTISGTPGSTTKIGEQYSFIPAATDPDNDPLTFSVQNRPIWASFDSATGNLSGMPSLGDVGTYSDIVLSVSDGSLTAQLPQFSIDVVQNANGSITLSWTAPTQNDDGSQITDLAAYKFYYGTSSGSYSNQLRVDNPGLTTYVIDNLTPSTYYVVATAINNSGAESSFSNEASKIVL